MRFVILLLCAILAACGGNEPAGRDASGDAGSKKDAPLHMPDLY